MTPQWQRTPIYRLIEHFFSRFFETSAVMRDPNDRVGLGPVLGFLAVPGAIMSLILFTKYSPIMRWAKQDWTFDRYLAAVPDKYTFIVFSMAATGICAVLKWESLFPDRRDFANLAPLPLPTRTIFFAKLSALTLFALVFAVDINLVSSILFPAIAMESYGTFPELLRFMASHAASVVAASTFAFCSFIAVAGFLMNVLPYAAFRRTARYLQFAVVTALVLMFLLTPLAASGLMRVRGGADTLHVWLPPVWFLGLSETWHGKATPAFQALGATAARALAAVVAIAAISYLAAYRRYFLRTAETPEIVGKVRGLPGWIWHVLDNTLLRSAFDRGCFRFATKTLFRSDRHNTVLAACLGFGVALATASTAAWGTALHVSGLLTLVYFLVTGLRLSFGIAQEERANWAFQIAVSESNPDARGVVRKFTLLAVALLVCASIPLYAAVSGLTVACVHAAFAFTNAVLLTEIVLVNFRSIPFTCTYLPSRDNLILGIAVFAVGLVVFADAGSLFEQWLILHPGAVLGYAIFIAGCMIALRVVRETNTPVEYVQRSGTLELLRLSE